MIKVGLILIPRGWEIVPLGINFPSLEQPTPSQLCVFSNFIFQPWFCKTHFYTIIIITFFVTKMRLINWTWDLEFPHGVFWGKTTELKL